MGHDVAKFLREHIKGQLAKKYSPADIKRALLEVGFDSKSIDEAFGSMKFKKIEDMPAVKKEPLFARLFSHKAEEKIEEKPAEKIKKPVEKIKAPIEKKQVFEKPAPQVPAPKIQLPKFEMPRMNIRAMGLHIVLIFCIICIGATIAFAPASCITKECFLEKANACEKATYQNSIAGVSVNYESTKDCTIIKTVESIPSTEPDEMKAKFVGKSMMCVYYENDFSPMHIESLAGLIINCEGPLKQELIKYIT